MPSQRTSPGSAAAGQRPERRYPRRPGPGELPTGEFLRRVLDDVRARLPEELQYLHARYQGSLIKLFAEEETIHFELWVHRSRGRVELGLHFETRDPDRNRRLLEYVSDDLPFLKEALGQGLEPEPWDKGWTRLYISYPLERLADEQTRLLAAAFALFIEMLEPIRREAVEEC